MKFFLSEIELLKNCSKNYNSTFASFTKEENSKNWIQKFFAQNEKNLWIWK